MFCSSYFNELLETYNFRPFCGRQVNDNEEESCKKEQDIIEFTFIPDKNMKKFLCFLEKYHGISIALSTRKRRLKEYGLERKTANDVNDEEIAKVMQLELDIPSCVSGYRSMWHIPWLKHGFSVPRDMVQRILKTLDPGGTEERKQHRLKKWEYKSTGRN